MADPLLDVLAEAQRLGFLGPGALWPVLTHAERFLGALPASRSRVLDLGSGGGVPGLVLAVRRAESEITLLDRSERRASFLRRAVSRLARTTGDRSLEDRVEVVARPAEEAGHDPGLRASFDVVVARGFGPPAVTAECGAPFLRLGGVLVVSEPPTPRRWDPRLLERLGLMARDPHDPALAAFEQVAPCPPRFPRRSPGRG